MARTLQTDNSMQTTVSQAKLFKSTLLQTCSTYYMCQVYIVPNQPLEAYSPLNPSILSPLMCPTCSSSSKPSKLQPYSSANLQPFSQKMFYLHCLANSSHLQPPATHTAQPFSRPEPLHQQEARQLHDLQHLPPAWPEPFRQPSPPSKLQYLKQTLKSKTLHAKKWSTYNGSSQTL